MKVKTILASALAVLTLTVIPATATAMTSENTTTSEAYIPSETTTAAIELLDTQELVYPTYESEYQLIDTQDEDQLLALIQECQGRKTSAHEMAEAARALGYPETHMTIKLAQNEWAIAEEYQTKYEETYEQVCNAEKDKQFEEYPAAATIWYYFKDLGYNDYICAGILGNIMAEVGGQTLNIQYWLYGNGYYGMCQWNKAYSSVWGADLNGQCNYLKNTIEYEFDTFGFCYASNFNFSSFLNLTDERAAALAFAKCYERCGSGSYTIRQNNAEIAYNYFVN